VELVPHLTDQAVGLIILKMVDRRCQNPWTSTWALPESWCDAPQERVDATRKEHAGLVRRCCSIALHTIFFTLSPVPLSHPLLPV